MRENRTYGSEGGAASNGIAPTPIIEGIERLEVSNTWSKDVVV